MPEMKVPKILLPVLISIMLLVSSAPADLLDGDLNSSGKVDVVDLRIFAGQWLNDPGCVGHPDDCADLIGEDGVNLADFNILRQNWLQYGIPSAPALSVPSNGSNVAGTNVQFSWLASAGAQEYYLQVAVDSSFNGLTYNASVGNASSVNLDSWPDNGTRYFWRVRAGNPGGWSSYSAVRYFDNGGTVFPPPPDLIFPEDESNVAGTNIDFSWLSSAGANNYHLQVADDAEFTSLIHDGDVGNVTSFNIADLPSDGSRIFWRVKAGNHPGGPVEENLISAQSTQWHYRKGQSEPPSNWRELGFTEDGTWQIGQAPIGYSNRGEFTPNTLLSDMYNNYTTVYVRHSFELDTPVGYELEKLTLRLFIDDGCIVSINNDELHRFNVSSGSKNYNDTSGLGYLNVSWKQTEILDISSIQEGTNILAIHTLNQDIGSSDLCIEAELIANFIPTGSGGWSEYTCTRYFDNGTVPMPSVPGLSLPADESNVAGTSIDFSWSNSVLAENYYLQVAADSGFNNLIYDGAVGNVTSINLGSFAYDGTRYYWRVRAGNSSGWSAYSDIWYFDNQDPPPPSTLNLKINEFMTSNYDIVDDEENEFDDWIEIYNGEDEAVDIGGMYLTDNLSNPTKWRIPDDSPALTTISPHGYLIIWADGRPEEGPLHVDFNLEKSGEEIGLFDSDGISMIDSITYDQQVTNVSFGRYPNTGTSWRFYGDPTPGTANTGTTYLGLVADPEFSVRRGFHEEAFNVYLTCTTPGATIYYTLDSSDPTESSTLYSGPVAITGTSCLRAAAFRTDYLPSSAVTHTYIFIDQVINHPNMWTTITNDPTWGPQIEGALLEIPSVSLVTPYTIPDIDPDPDAADPYLSPPEVPVSIEMFYPDGSKGFQANAGAERFGGKYTVWEKQALRISFKSMYGPSRLNHDLFSDTPYGGKNAVKSFNQIILRNGSHDSLFYSGYTSKGVYTRSRYCYDRQIEMGHLSLRGKFVHVYQNGDYRGLYHLMERPTADFMAQYDGGDEKDYDIVKGRSGFRLKEGTREAWDYLQANTGNYEIVKDYVDIDNLIDYLILNFYGGNDHDWYENHNWVAGRKREPGGKWKFFMWDNDFLSRRINGNTLNNNAPGKLYTKLKVHEEFRMRMADRAQKHFFNDGMLTPARVIADFTALTNRIQRVVIPEYARWSLVGSNGSFTPNTLHQSVNWINTTWANSRTDITLQQMRDDGVFPNIDAPSFNQHGGAVASGFTLEITAPAGTIYYTLDGSDPRQVGGDVAGIVYSGPITLTRSTLVKARAKSGSTWSALNEATFGIDPTLENLRITEIMYHPTDPTQAEKAAVTPDPIDEDFEFIEVRNIGAASINLNLVHFTDGIDFTFGDYTLGAGAFAVIVRNQDAFMARYPGVSASLIAGTYTGALDNNGEEIVVRNAIGEEIQDFDYNDGWFEITDGYGFSLTIKDVTSTDPNSWDQKSGWRPSASIDGSPGADDTGHPLEAGSIKINELLAHSDSLYSYDWIELYNTTGTPINIGGWYLSDNNNNLKKYTIPDGTVIDAYDYCVFYEDLHFGVGNPIDPNNVPFALSENGETLYLNSGLGGVLTGYSEEEEFDASQADVTFGRYQKSTGTFNFVAMSAPTPGTANAYPKVGPIVISEIMYNPLSEGDAEYVELMNISNSTVTLQEWDSIEGINVPWRFTDEGGITLDFPLGTTINPGEKILLVKNLTIFEVEFGSSVPGQKFEWGSGKLSNGGEKIQLSMPGDMEDLTRRYIRVDRVNYSDGSHPVGDDPWPAAADGDGMSLTRKTPSNYGNDPANWESSTPTPGS